MPGGERDEGLVSYEPEATDTARATWSAADEVFADRGPGYTRFACGVSYDEIDAVGP